MINQSENYSYYYYSEIVTGADLSMSLDALYNAFIIFLAILGIFFNACTIAIITKGTKFGKGIQIQLINLAVADILCSLVALVTKISDSIEGVPISLILQFCEVLHLLIPLVFQASLLSNTAISLERLVAVYFPLRMREYRQRHVIITTITIWLLAAMTNIYWLLQRSAYDDLHPAVESKCTLRYHVMPTEIQEALYMIINCLPVTIIVASYTLIGIKLMRRKVIGEQHKSSSSHINKRVRRLEII